MTLSNRLSKLEQRAVHVEDDGTTSATWRAIEADPLAARAVDAFNRYTATAETPAIVALRALTPHHDRRDAVNLIISDPGARELAVELGRHLSEVQRSKP